MLSNDVELSKLLKKEPKKINKNPGMPQKKAAELMARNPTVFLFTLFLLDYQRNRPTSG
jgi:hypothetical protein